MLPFVYRLIGPRPTFAVDMNDDERETMTKHAAYWGQLMVEGRVVAFGPVDDPGGSYGLGIVLADDMSEVEALRDGDPAVTSPHGLRVEIAPMFRLLTPSGTYG
ncbi:MAG: hypothetical protein QOI36_1791 [Pseudonocardiales bacterium]|jgi:uncharacterized protein YciI|nr:hypothetical protein [Pseudonocardia sp.]MDT7650385.1 hypothetical protein [Pseudonocardiales bacterium]